jgi:hypothetical protein
MMVTVAKGYDLDYVGRAVGEAYRAAGTISRPRRQRAAGHLVQFRNDPDPAPARPRGWRPWRRVPRSRSG